MASTDPTTSSRWRPLHRLLAAMDDEIAQVYEGLGISDLKPTWVVELLRLDAHGPMTITELAESTQRTHSAMSQKVSAMQAAGFVRTAPGRDARSKQVTLTAKARRITGRLAAEWRATEAAIAELETEIPYPLSRVAADIQTALEHKSFRERILQHLDDATTTTPSAPDATPRANRLTSGSSA
ncbi:MAG: winged helix-turn-helix transcriptional regulator [Solirubrobacterales bacterium]|nr:winged helix-turn-helix transcriptional regulator [Solirubrobacterales bacterium]